MPQLSFRKAYVALGLAVLALSSVPAPAQLTRARVTEGTLLGKPVGAVTAYLGVPYAAPPIAGKRWKPPAPATSWNGERQAREFGAVCQQMLTPNGIGPWTREYITTGPVSEDCLFLNVWTPARTAQERLPVFFWIPGGGFTTGSGSVPIYDGAALAAKGIVVVGINYRLGLYGFLAHPELSAESPAHASGNYALLDQLAALRWVQANIAALGGDPRRVTIAGQSAGAASVHWLIASPLAKGLFAQAIAQSGSGMGMRLQDHAAAEALGVQLGKAGGNTLGLAELRKLTPAQLDERVARMISPSAGADRRALPFAPSVDGVFLADAAAAENNTNDTPILTGMTANVVSGIHPDYGKMTVVSYNSELTAVYGPLAPEIAGRYPARRDQDVLAAYDAYARDRGLASMYQWATRRLRTTRHPIYTYLWTHVEPGPDAARYKAFHSSEIPYVFDTLDTAERPFTAQDRAIAARMSDYWVNFVKFGDPNGKGLPKWPAFTATDKLMMELGDRAEPRTLLGPDQLEVFEKFTKAGGRLTLF